MAAHTPHTGFGGAAHFGSAALVRLLSQWGQAVPAADAPSVQRLGQWLSWTDAVAVARVLSDPASDRADAASVAAGACAPGAPAGPALSAPSAADGAAAAAVLAEVDAQRWVLQAAAAALGGPESDSAAWRHPADRRRSSPVAAEAEDPLDLALHQRRYRKAQRQLADGIGPLRLRLRGALSALGGTWHRLAALDAALDEAMTPRERQALTLVPAALARRFEHHRQGAAPGWITAFHHDQRRALQAELALRWAPLAGLMAALQGVVQAADPTEGNVAPDAAAQVALAWSPPARDRADPSDAQPGRQPVGAAERLPKPPADPLPAPATTLITPSSA